MSKTARLAASFLALGALVSAAVSVGRVPPAQPSHADASRRTPAALAGLFSQFDAVDDSGGARVDPTLLAAVDAAAAQRDAWRTRLFWYTNLDDALAAARSQNKPVLSLRLLGRLDEELSCANSRFFRKTLYVDPTVNALLRDRFVLHWQSLRPAPLLTIDYGDGHVVRRTITGNSIHYALLPDGRPFDALPGLYDATTFAAALTRIADFGASAPTSAALEAYWCTPLAVPNVAISPVALRGADRASSLAVSKFVVQRPTLTATRNPSEIADAEAAIAQSRVRPVIRGWLRAGAGVDLDAMNRRVYAELFLAPLDDPDMGLNPPDEAAFAPALVDTTQ